MIARTCTMVKSSTDRAGAQAFSPLEEEFFRAGDAISAAASHEPGSDHDAAAAPRARVWSRLIKRVRRPITEQPSLAEPAPRPRAATEPAATEDDWDWQIAIARVRHPTNA